MATTKTVKQVMQQNLVRGAKVKIAESFGDPSLHGKTMVVTSKEPVKCNKGNRCAGDYCVGQAVFVTDSISAQQKHDPGTKKRVGWRANTKKVCLTHLKNPDDNELLVPPPSGEAPKPRKTRQKRTPTTSTSRLPTQPVPNGGSEETEEVSWNTLAEAHASKDTERLAQLLVT